MQRKLIFWSWLVTSVFSSTLSAEDIILYGSHQSSYQTQLLKHALSYLPDKNYQVVNFSGQLPKDRAFGFINKAKQLDVIYGGATMAREQIALPVRIPILKGLNGWRLPLVNKQRQALFDDIQTIAEFKRLVPGQFHSWSDTKVLESNNIRVEKGSNFEGLFLMLDKRRFDYFPRSIVEIQREYQAHKMLDITINNSVLIHYPTAYYYYVANNNQALAQDITYGLEQAINDGSFDQLFYRHYQAVLDNIKSDKLKVFSLKNPYLSDKTPLNRKELWISLNSFSDNIIQ